MTKEELEKIRAKFLQLEQKLEENITLYKADGRITKDERIQIKKSKKALLVAKKALHQALRNFKKEQKLLAKANKRQSSGDNIDADSSNDEANQATFLGSNVVGTATYVTLENDLDKLLKRSDTINNTIVGKQHYHFMPATTLAVNKNLLTFQKLVAELEEIQQQIPAAFKAVKDKLNEKDLVDSQNKMKKASAEFNSFSGNLSRHLSAQKKLESSLKTNKEGETVLDLGEPALPEGLRRKPVYEVFDLPVFEGDEGDFCKIDNNDVEQLKNGNCTLIAALMQIASKEPKLIKKAIQPKGETTKKGKIVKKYSVTLYLPQKDKEGKKVKVLVSNEFYSSGGRDPFFVGKGDGEIWVLLIEKAVASLLGGYAIFEKDGYSLNMILSVLTGQPSPPEVILEKQGMDAEELKKWFIANKDKVITVANDAHAYSVSEVDTDNEIITLIDPLSLKEFRYDIRTIKKNFAQVAAVSLTADKGCPDDMINEAAKPTKPIETTNSFLKLSKEDQLLLLGMKDKVTWKTIDGVGVIHKVDADLMQIEIDGMLQEIRTDEVTQWKFQPIIASTDLETVLGATNYVTWISKDNTEYNFTSVYKGLFGFDTSNSDFIEIPIDEVYQKFGILKK